MRRLLGAAFALVAGLAGAAEPAAGASTVHERGEFRFAVGAAPEHVVAITVPAQWDPKVGGDDDRWRNWLLDRQIDRRGAQPVDYYDHAYEAMTPELVAEAAKFSIDFNPGYQQLTLHRVELRREGKWEDRLDPARISLARRESGFEDDMSDGAVTALIVLPDVRPRDVVRIAYSVRGGNPIMADSIANAFPIAWVDPILERHAKAVYPRDAKVGVRKHGTDVTVARTESADAQAFEIREHGVPAVRDQGNYPRWYSPFPFVEIGPDRGWGDVVAWALPLYPETVELPADLQARIATWRALPDPRKQVMAVLTAVQEEVRYFGVEMGENTHRPHPPGETWARRFGDCKDKVYLMVSLLRALGMDAEPALVSTDTGRSVRDHLPAASAFDHVIVRLRLDGRSYWLDPTATQQRGDLDKIDVADFGYALPIAVGVRALAEVRAPGQPENVIEVVERFVPGADGQAIELFVETRYGGQRAEEMRRRLRSNRMQDVASHYEDYYRKSYGELTVLSPASMSEDEAANTVLVKEHYRLTPGWESTGVTTRTLSAFADALRGDVIVPNSLVRTAPIDLANPATLRHEINVELPEGWSLDDAPEDYAVESPSMRYQRTLSNEGRRVTLVHRLDVRKSEVEGAEVGDYLAKVRDIRGALDRNLNLRLPANIGRSERDRRLQDLLQDVLSEERK
jgi:hypothetical protein